MLCSRGLVYDDKWTYYDYDMFKTRRATVQAFVQAQCIWPDKWRPMNRLGCSPQECHMDVNLLEKRHTRYHYETYVHLYKGKCTWIFKVHFHQFKHTKERYNKNISLVSYIQLFAEVGETQMCAQIPYFVDFRREKK